MNGIAAAREAIAAFMKAYYVGRTEAGDVTQLRPVFHLLGDDCPTRDGVNWSFFWISAFFLVIATFPG